MLSLFLNDVTDGSSGLLIPERISSSLHMSLARLAQVAKVHRNTLQRHPESPAVQAKLGEVARVVAAASDLLGDTERAVLWFRHQPLAGFDGRTAEELVADGHTDAVLTHLELLRDGTYA
jgi:uncharacterized protein (DUF2384 family)